MKRRLAYIGFALAVAAGFLVGSAWGQLGTAADRVASKGGEIVLHCFDRPDDPTTPDVDEADRGCEYDITILDADRRGMDRWQGRLEERGPENIKRAMDGVLTALRARVDALLSQ